MIEAQGGLAAVAEQHTRLRQEAAAVRTERGPMAVVTDECAELGAGRA